MTEPGTEPAPETPAPRYLRFVTALVLRTTLIVLPAGLGGCLDCDGTDEPPDASVVDGPLPPPDLPRTAVA